MEFNWLKAAELLNGESLLLTANSEGVPGTPLIDLGMMKGCINLRELVSDKFLKTKNVLLLKIYSR